MNNKVELNVGNVVQIKNSKDLYLVRNESKPINPMLWQNPEPSLELVSLKNGSVRSIHNEIEIVYEDYTLSNILYKKPKGLSEDELRTMWTLLKKFKKERILECIEKDPETNFQEFEDEDWYDYDDGDNLINSCDNLLSIIENELN